MTPDAGAAVAALREDLAAARRALDRLEDRLDEVESILAAERAPSAAPAAAPAAAGLLVESASESDPLRFIDEPVSTFGGNFEPGLEDFSLPSDDVVTAEPALMTSPPIPAPPIPAPPHSGPPQSASHSPAPLGAVAPSDDELAALLRQVGSTVHAEATPTVAEKGTSPDGRRAQQGSPEPPSRAGVAAAGDRVDFSTDDLETILGLGRG